MGKLENKLFHPIWKISQTVYFCTSKTNPVPSSQPTDKPSVDKIGVNSATVSRLLWNEILKIRSHRLGVRTPGFHPGNRGSIPLGTAKKPNA